MSSPLSFRATAITDIGLVRRQNEDRFICDSSRILFGVADGVGGLPGGAHAAQSAIRSIEEAFPAEGLSQAQDWRPLMESANTSVVAKGHQVGSHLGIASTLTIGTLAGNNLLIAHIGDSRCLLHRAGVTSCITTDHSAENEAKLDTSKPTPPAKWRLALARCLGQQDDLNPDFIAHPLLPADRILFATDGITRIAGEEEIFACLNAEKPPAEGLADLIDLIHERGAPDNATAVLVEILPSSDD